MDVTPISHLCLQSFSPFNNNANNVYQYFILIYQFPESSHHSNEMRSLFLCSIHILEHFLPFHIAAQRVAHCRSLIKKKKNHDDMERCFTGSLYRLEEDFIVTCVHWKRDCDCFIVMLQDRSPVHPLIDRACVTVSWRC